MNKILKIVITPESKKKTPDTCIGGITFGTVFSGTLDKVTGIFMVADGGVFRLDQEDQPYPMGHYFLRFNNDGAIDMAVKNYKELDAVLSIKA